MTKRKTPLLAYCEYVSRDPKNSIQVWRARLRLIEATKSIYPLFLERLGSDVFPAYRELADKAFDFDCILWSPRKSPFEALPEECRLRVALSSWAVEFNAETPWLMDQALRTLWYWHIAPDARQTLSWYKMYAHSGSISTGERFSLDCEGWETELFTWQAYSESVRERFDEKLLKYERETRARAESVGLIRARRTFSAESFEWFVLYQFAGLSSVQITNRWKKHNGVDVSTVLKGVKTAAKLIEWGPLRPPVDPRQHRKTR